MVISLDSKGLGAAVVAGVGSKLTQPSGSSGAVVMSLDSEGLGAAVVTGVGSNLTQPSSISLFSLYIYI